MNRDRGPRAWLRAALTSFGAGSVSGDADFAVRSAFFTLYPGLEITDVWFRARDGDRDIVAVLYRASAGVRPTRGMPACKHFAVDRDTGVTLLTEEEASRYAGID